MMVVLGVAAGGALGALARYSVSMALGPRIAGGFPWATLSVNIADSLLLGILTALAFQGRLGPPSWQAFLMTGFCGALTTFSTFSVESLLLIKEGTPGLALASITANFIVCIAAAGLGLWMMRGAA